MAKDSTVQAKREATNRSRYGSSCVLSNKEVKEKSKVTMLKKYGVENGLSGGSPIRQKAKDTLMEKYGVDNPFRSVKIKEKTKVTMMEKYGVENGLSDGSPIRQKAKDTMIEKYGVDNPFKLKIFQDKADETMLRKYGVASPFQTAELREKFTQTMMENYGIEHAHQSVEFRNKFTQTMIERHGVSHALQQHIPIETIALLEDKTWLVDQHHTKQKTITKIAEELNVSPTGVGMYLKRHNIEIMSRPSSQFERDISEYVQSIGCTTYQNTRSIISPFELDIFIPEKSIAIECDGVFWHSELQGKDKSYHLNKTKMCEQQNIRLVHIYDNEWYNKQEIVKSRISSLLGANDTIHARKTDIRTLTSRQCATFFNDNHIQGNVGANIGYGLFHDDQLVAAITFGKSRFSKQAEWELIRFANKKFCSVVGGASKLFKHFVKVHSPPSIISYSDIRWNTGKLYQNLGFNHIHTSSPNYHYFLPHNTSLLFSRNVFQKHKLAAKLQVFNPQLTEWENMQANGYDRIWDCGNSVWIWKQC